ncbi:hypothetical protein [Sphaerospermopsis torques-reginae]|nr:hypothetical protein [Sphaerospermopsis torques-reginae]
MMWVYGSDTMGLVGAIALSCLIFFSRRGAERDTKRDYQLL